MAERLTAKRQHAHGFMLRSSHLVRLLKEQASIKKGAN
jgi:hypothetical protein